MPQDATEIPFDLAYLFESVQINTEELRKIEFTEMPEWIAALVKSFHKENYCHYNSMSLVNALINSIPVSQSELSTGIKYVVGYLVGLDIAEHAFVKIGSTYYDPTLSLRLTAELDVYALAEISAGDMSSMLDKYQMQDHGLLMMNLRRDREFSHLFVEPADLMLKTMKRSLEIFNEQQLNANMHSTLEKT